MSKKYDIKTIENPHVNGGALHTDMLRLAQEIFGPGAAAKIEQKLPQRPRALLVAAHAGDEVLGFKLGYEEKAGKFYSWLGGVSPQARKSGIGRALMEAQHAWCREQGYARIETRTKNHWRDMLVLNLKSGFDIIGTYTDEKGEPKIIMEKRLAA